MGLKKLSQQEECVLREIAQRALDLPLPLAAYVRDIGRLREEMFGKNPGNGRSANKPRGFVDGHQVRATVRYGA